MNHVYHRFWYRVGIVAALAFIPLAGPVAVHAQTQPEMRVTLLGTGTPTLSVDRFGPSTLIEAGSADLFIHEVSMAKPEVAQTEAAKRILAHHTSPQEARRVFSIAKPRLAVYAHISSAGAAACRTHRGNAGHL